MKPALNLPLKAALWSTALNCLQVEKNRALGGIGCRPTPLPFEVRRTFTIFHQRKKRKIRLSFQSTFKHLPLLMPNSSVPHDSQKAYCIHL